jgi:hypothetical protein
VLQLTNGNGPPPPFGNRIVFGNLRHNKQLTRFTLRGRKKVDAQWKLYCMVHNIEKLAHHGYAQWEMEVG